VLPGTSNLARVPLHSAATWQITSMIPIRLPTYSASFIRIAVYTVRWPAVEVNDQILGTNRLTVQNFEQVRQQDAYRQMRPMQYATPSPPFQGQHLRR